MFEYIVKKFRFRHRMIWYADSPMERKNEDMVTYYYSRSPGDDFKIERGKVQAIDLSPNLDKIFYGFNETTRNEIRQIQALNPTVTFNSDYDAFFNLENLMTRKKKLHQPDLTTINFRQQEHLLITIRFDKYRTPLACDFAAIHNNAFYMNFVTNALYAEERIKEHGLISKASRLAHWELIKQAKIRGFSFATVGSLDGNSKYDSNNQFKKGFGGEEMETIEYRKIFNPLLKLAHILSVGMTKAWLPI